MDNNYVKAGFQALLIIATAILLCGFDYVKLLQDRLPIIFALAFSTFCIYQGWMFLQEGAELGLNEAVLCAKEKNRPGLVPLIVSIGTAITEFSFTLIGLQKGQPNIVFSAIAESDLFNASFVFGSSILVARDKIFEVSSLSKAVYLTVIMTALIAVVGYLGYNPMLCIAIIGVAIWASFIFLNNAPKGTFDEENEPATYKPTVEGLNVEFQTIEQEKEIFSFYQLMVGFAMLTLGSFLFYDGVIFVINWLSWPKFVVGIAAAVSASAAELVVVIPKVRKGKMSLAMALTTALMSNCLDSAFATLPGIFGLLNGFSPSQETFIQASSSLLITAFIGLVVFLRVPRLRPAVGCLLVASFVASQILLIQH